MLKNLEQKVTLKAKLWQLVLAIGVLLAAFLALGSSHSEPQFKAYATSLKPQVVEPSQKPLKPVIISKVEKVATLPPDAPRPSTEAQTGGLGYIMPGSNCVACANALTGRAQNGNAGSHIPTHSTPKVGDIMIWFPGEQGAGAAGHVGVVVGVQGSTVQIAHCNWGGGQTSFASTGKFY